LAVLLGLDRRRVLLVALDLERRRNLPDLLGKEAGVPGRHGTTNGRETRGRRIDLGAGDLGEGGEVAGVGDEFGAPLTECLAGLALPVDPGDVALKLVGGFLDGGLGVPQSGTRGLQVLRVR
jgi:hypothetical protein